MQVILSQDVPKLGYRGEVVNVKPGFFRNYLMPRGMADMATEAKLKMAEVRKEKKVMERQQLLENAKDVLEKLADLTIKIKGKATAKGKLYASVAEKDVIDAVAKAAKVKLEKDFVKMEHLKEVGEHNVLIHLGEGLETKIKVVIEAGK